jgi:hypothetical protein
MGGLGGMGATMGGYLASMVAPIPSTNDGICSFNVTNTFNIFDEEEGEKKDNNKKDEYENGGDKS